MIKAKQHVTSTQPATHGAFDYEELARLGLSANDVIDFSVNSNPYGPPSSVYEALARVPLDRYPDRECLALREKLAERHGVASENIVVGNGTAELLLLIGFAFLERGMTAVVPQVTFSEYERAARIVGAEVRFAPWPLVNPDDKIDRLSGVLDGAQIVFLCNPNNPDGTFLAPEWIVEHWAQAHPETLFVIDEAYANFMVQPRTLIGASPRNVLVVRSMTKDYALAGLRLGYVVGHPELVEAIRRVRPAWNVNSLAQAAGLAVLDEDEWLRESVGRLHEHKRDLIDGLHALGFTPLPSATHYFLMPVGSGHEFRAQLLKHNIMVRDCASFGLPDYARIVTRTPDANARLLEAIATATGTREPRT